MLNRKKVRLKKSTSYNDYTVGVKPHAQQGLEPTFQMNEQRKITWRKREGDT